MHCKQNHSLVAVGINGGDRLDFVDVFGGIVIFILLFYEPQN